MRIVVGPLRGVAFREPYGSKVMTARAEWTIDKRSTTFVVIVFACVVAVFALLHRRSQDVGWPLVKGVVKETRIVVDHSLQTKWGSELTWKAEYRVEYFVASRKYDIWVDSGIRGESQDGVQLALPSSHPDCRVQYNPENPAGSRGNCQVIDPR